MPTPLLPLSYGVWVALGSETRDTTPKVACVNIGIPVSDRQCVAALSCALRCRRPTRQRKQRLRRRAGLTIRGRRNRRGRWRGRWRPRAGGLVCRLTDDRRAPGARKGVLQELDTIPTVSGWDRIISMHRAVSWRSRNLDALACKVAICSCAGKLRKCGFLPISAGGGLVPSLWSVVARSYCVGEFEPTWRRKHATVLLAPRKARILATDPH